MKRFIYPMLVVVLGVMLWSWLDRAKSPPVTDSKSDLEKKSKLQSIPEVQEKMPLQPENVPPVSAITPEITTVNAGGVSLPIVFQNSSVSHKLKNLILADLNYAETGYE